MKSPEASKNGINGHAIDLNKICLVQKIISVEEAVRIATTELGLPVSYKLGSQTPDMSLISVALLQERDMAIEGHKYSCVPMTYVEHARRQHEALRKHESTHVYGSMM